MTEVTRWLFAALLATAAAGGCNGGGSKTNSDGSAVMLSPAPCGGTVTAIGTTPAGAFDGTLVTAMYDGCSNGVAIWIGDAANGLIFNFSAPYQTTDGGAPIVPGDAAARGELDRANPPSVVARTSGLVDVITADILPGDAALSGQVSGTFVFAQDGFDLSGTFASPYCRHMTLCGD
jgi:hypothetical protein